jgi:hypothetical protein
MKNQLPDGSPKVSTSGKCEIKFKIEHTFSISQKKNIPMCNQKSSHWTIMSASKLNYYKQKSLQRFFLNAVNGASDPRKIPPRCDPHKMMIRMGKPVD